MLKMKPIDYDLVRFFVYCNDSITIHCSNRNIIITFLADITDMDFSLFNNFIVVRNCQVNFLARLIRICNNYGIEYGVI